MGAQGLRTRAIRLTATALVCAGLAIPGLSARGDAAASAPQVTVTTEVSPRVLNSIDQRSLTLNVGIVNNGPAVQVDVTIGGHRWPAAALTDGGPLGFGSPTLEPPATFMPVPVPPITPSPLACVRGEAVDGRQYGVGLPALSTTVLRVPLLALVPYWPGTNYTPEVTWWTTNSTFPKMTRVVVKPIQMTGPTGVHIELATRPRDKVTIGRAITIVGTTDPAIQHRRIKLTANYFPVSDGSPVLRSRITSIADVITNEHGRFKLPPWHLKHPGFYQLLSRAEHPGHGVQPDRACGPLIQAIAHPTETRVPTQLETGALVGYRP